jgi:type III pantothenate kinase
VKVEIEAPSAAIGRNTQAALRSGIVYGFAGQVDGIADRMLDALGNAVVIATGGLAATIAPYTRTIEHIEPWLTLHGLRLIHAKNQ